MNTAAGPDDQIEEQQRHHHASDNHTQNRNESHSSADIEIQPSEQQSSDSTKTHGKHVHINNDGIAHRKECQIEHHAGQMPLSENGGQPSGQFATDSELQAVVDAWPTLTDKTRYTILRAVQRESASK